MGSVGVILHLNGTRVVEIPSPIWVMIVCDRNWPSNTDFVFAEWPSRASAIKKAGKDKNSGYGQ
jgi:hypothetical protein